MRRKIVAVTLAGTLGLTGAALFAPGLANAQTAQGESSGVGGRLEALKEALKGLVTDGTLDQAQADTVAQTLAEKFPGKGHGPGRGPGHSPGHGAGLHGPGSALSRAAVAGVLGIEVDELRTEREAGKTLAQIAKARGITREVLLERLTAAATTELADAVTQGRLTQEQADKRLARLPEHLAKFIDKVGTKDGPRADKPADD